MVSLEELIKAGDSIRKDIKYVPPRPTTWRTFSEYALKDRVAYSTWKNQSFIYLQNVLKDEGALKRFEEQCEQFEKHHNDPQYLDNMLGILSAYRDMGYNDDEQSKVDSKKVFVVYGHDRLMKLEVENFLRSKFKLDVVALDEEPNSGRTIIEKFEHYSKECAFAVILMSPDDDVDVNGQIYKRARQNVVLELGYFMAKLGRDKVCVLVRGDIEKPSDISGILHLSYDGEWKIDLLTELKNAGIEV